MSMIPLFVLGALGVFVALSSSDSSSSGGGVSRVPSSVKEANAAGYFAGVEAANKCLPKKTEAELRSSASQSGMSEELLVAAMEGYNVGYDATYKVNVTSGKCKPSGTQPTDGTGTTGTKPVCMTPDVAASTTIGDIQRKLMALGYSVGSSGDDGVCGKDTRAAVSEFQTNNGLRATGVVDAATLQQINYGMSI